MRPPSGADTSASRREPPRTSSVPSPPSATGIAVASAPPARSPRASASAASRADKTPFRLPGAASARIGFLLLRHLALPRAAHPLQHRERQALAREEGEPDAHTDRRLNRMQPDPEREAARVPGAGAR